MIRFILNLFSSMLAFAFRLFRPAAYYWNRILYLALAKAKMKHLPASVQFDGRVQVTGSADIAIGTESRIGRDVELGTEERGVINIGQHVRINRGTTVFAYNKITIGDDTLIGEFATIRDANHGIKAGQTIHSQPHQADAIAIGSDVWIGRGAVILPGVTIGNGSIIGANSVVTKSIPSGSIAVGSPAKVIRKR